MATNTFVNWLIAEMKQRNWSPAELARQTGMSPSQITRLLNGERGIGNKGLEAIAHAFKYPPEYVYEQAGLFKPKEELSPIKRKLMHLAKDLPDEDIELAISILEQRKKQQHRPQVKTAK